MFLLDFIFSSITIKHRFSLIFVDDIINFIMKKVFAL